MCNEGSRHLGIYEVGKERGLCRVSIVVKLHLSEFQLSGFSLQIAEIAVE